MAYRSTLAVTLALVAAAGCKGDPVDTSVDVNAAPTIAAVFVTPDPATADDTLTCTWVGYDDAEGDVDLSSAKWSVNGTEVGEGSTLAGGFGKGDTVSCDVVPFDGTTEGAAVSASVTIANLPPTVALATITPDPASSDDVLTCAWQGFDDPDGDADASTVTWAVNGINAGSGTELVGGFGGGDTVTCYVTPFDGEDTGPDVSASVVIDNVAPTIDAVTITPDPAYAADTLVCGWTGFADADGDADQSSAAWKVNGVVVGSGRTLSDRFEGGDLVECVVTPFDGQDAGPVRIGSATIADSPPAISSVSISPPNPGTNSTLTCSWAGFTDADGDADRSKVEWSVNGTAVGSGTTLAGAFDRDDTVTCEVTPFDGSVEGTPLTADVVIDNGTPSIGSVTVTPNPAYVGDSLSCAWSGYSDPDGDADQSVVSWSVNGLSAGSTPTLAGVFTGRDVVQCTVTPFDGSDTGASKSSSLTVTNSIPSISGVQINPDPAFADDVLTCSWSGFSDDDGDNDQTRVSWQVNGVDAGFGVTLSGVFTGADVVQCTATPSDGFNDGTPLSTSVTIGSSTPSVTGLFISPNPAVVGDTLTCGWTFVDIDGDPDMSTVTWRVNGSPAGAGVNLSSGFTSGDTVQCTVTPNDGGVTGTPVSTSLVVNTPPSIVSVEITPDDAGAADVLSCSWTGFTDVDGDPDVSLRSWEVNGADAGAGASPSLPYVRGDEVACLVTPYDGYSFGAGVGGSIMVANTPPTVATATISPEVASAGDTLTCAYDGYDDVDGDADASTINWYVNGALETTGDTLTGGFGGSDEIICEVVPNDGFDAGVPVTDTLITENTEPTMVSVTITPSPLFTNDVALANPVSSDPDGDAVTYTYQWFRNGVAVAGGTTDMLDGAADFDKNDLLWVTVTPNDGAVDGAALTSASLAVSNTAPSAPVVEITASGFADDGDDLVCNFSTPAIDPDPSDSLSYSYQWFRDGGLYPDLDDTIASSATSLGEEWICFATAFDGTAYSAAGSGTVIIGTPMASTVPDELPAEGSPYYAEEDITLPLRDVTHIAPGVVIYGLGHTLTVQGELFAHGTVELPIVFEDLDIVGERVRLADAPYGIFLRNVEVYGGTVLEAEEGAGRVELRDAIFAD